MKEKQIARKRPSYWRAVSINFAAGLAIGLIVGVLAVSACSVPQDVNAECNYTLYAAEPSERIKTANIEVTPQTEEDTGPQFVSLGEFRITAYCPCAKCCGKTDGITATGTQATQGRTIAVDPDVIPYGTAVYIDGVEYIAEDCGGAIKVNRVDLYFDNHADALEYGVQTKELYIMEG